MIWMSNPAWPSLTWNTYDYFMDATGTYFACKKACEPIHIQWNPVSNKVKAINNTSKELKGLKIEAAVHNLDGSVAYSKSASQIDCAANCNRECLTLFVSDEDKLDGLSSVHFISLTLKDNAGVLLSNNFYWRSKKEWKYEDMGNMKPVTLKANAGELKEDKLTVEIENATERIALAVRVKAFDLETGQLAAR